MYTVQSAKPQLQFYVLMYVHIYSTSTQKIFWIKIYNLAQNVAIC